jgi:Transposase IS4
VFGIADHGYLYNWIWSSREKGLQEVLYFPNLTNIRCLVRTLAFSLLCRYLIIYLDNYFTSIPLFTKLQACNFGAVGTTRPYKEFPSQLVELKTRFATKLEWNILLAAVVKDVLCLAWQDNNIVLALSNIRIINRVEDFLERQRKRLVKISTNRRIVRKVFGEEYIKELSIPCFIDDYNHNIGGVDLANQFRESYETHRAIL